MHSNSRMMQPTIQSKKPIVHHVTIKLLESVESLVDKIVNQPSLGEVMADIKAVTQHTNENVTIIKNMIKKHKLLAFNQLKSGNVTLLAATVTDMEILLQKHGEWAGILSTKAQVVVLTFGVIAHGVLTASMHLETDTAAEGMWNKLQAQNTINIPRN